MGASCTSLPVCHVSRGANWTAKQSVGFNNGVLQKPVTLSFVLYTNTVRAVYICIPEARLMHMPSLHAFFKKPCILLWGKRKVSSVKEVKSCLLIEPKVTNMSRRVCLFTTMSLLRRLNWMEKYYTRNIFLQEIKRERMSSKGMKAPVGKQGERKRLLVISFLSGF